jgi:hypothetical protein
MISLVGSGCHTFSMPLSSGLTSVVLSMGARLAALINLFLYFDNKGHDLLSLLSLTLNWTKQRFQCLVVGSRWQQVYWKMLCMERPTPLNQ